MLGRRHRRQQRGQRVAFGGVGRGTVVDHVQVRQTLDDCFEFFGGTVDAKYLACEHNEDDRFDFDLGYTGDLQFRVLQQDPTHEGDDNGIESDNDDKGTGNLPLTAPTVYNVTLCRRNASVAKEQYGLLLRKNTRGTYRNLVVAGFQAALDIRDAIGAPGELSIANSLFSPSTRVASSSGRPERAREAPASHRAEAAKGRRSHPRL